MALNNLDAFKYQHLACPNPFQSTARDRTALSTVRQRLADISRLSFEAINSDSHRHGLLTAWEDMRKDAALQSLSDPERRLLVEVSHNSKDLARVMSGVESLLEDIVVEVEAIVVAGKLDTVK